MVHRNSQLKMKNRQAPSMLSRFGSPAQTFEMNEISLARQKGYLQNPPNKLKQKLDLYGIKYRIGFYDGVKRVAVIASENLWFVTTIQNGFDYFCKVIYENCSDWNGVCRFVKCDTLGAKALC